MYEMRLPAARRPTRAPEPASGSLFSRTPKRVLLSPMFWSGESYLWSPSPLLRTRSESFRSPGREEAIHSTLANTPIRASTGNGSGFMFPAQSEMHASWSDRLANREPETRGSSSRLVLVRTGIRFFDRTAADRLGVWLGSQEGSPHHARVSAGKI